MLNKYNTINYYNINIFILYFLSISCATARKKDETKIYEKNLQLKNYKLYLTNRETGKNFTQRNKTCKKSLQKNYNNQKIQNKVNTIREKHHLYKKSKEPKIISYKNYKGKQVQLLKTIKTKEYQKFYIEDVNDFYPIEIIKIKIKINRKLKEIVFIHRFNAGVYDSSVKQILYLNKNQNTKIANEILSTALDITKYNKDMSQKGIEENGKYLLIQFALERGADVNSVSIIQAIPTSFIQVLKDSTLAIAILLSWGIKIDNKYKNNKLVDYLEDIAYHNIKHYLETEKIWKKNKKPLNGNHIRIRKKELISKKEFITYLGGLFTKNIKIANKALFISKKELKQEFLKNYLTKICEDLLKEEQKQNLDPKFITLIKKYGITDKKILKKLELRTKINTNYKQS